MMFTSVSKTASGRYVFAVGDDPTDDSRCWLHSVRDAALLGEVPATFSSFGEAHAFASRLIDDRPSAVMAKRLAGMQSVTTDTSSDDAAMIAEGEALAHYAAQVEAIVQRIEAALESDRRDSAEELDAVSKEAEGVMGELRGLSEIASDDGKTAIAGMASALEAASGKVKERTGERTASFGRQPFPRSVAKAAVRAFSEAAMRAISPLHEDVFVKGASSTPRGYESLLSTPRGDIVRLAFDRHLLLSGVYPCGGALGTCGGLHDERFLVRYWEPIVDAVGHFHSRGHGVVAVADPRRRLRHGMPAFGTDDNSLSTLSVERPVVMGHRTWTLKRTAATVTTPPSSEFAVDDEVVCVRQDLPTYAGRTGTVSAIDQKPAMLLLRVDFRRGLGPVWLSSDSVRRVSIGE